MLLARVLLRVGAVAPVAGALTTSGLGAAVSAAAVHGGTILGGVLATGGAVGMVVVSADKFIDDLKGEFDLPTIIYTPYTIFSNKVPLFDINFFNPLSDVGENGKSISEYTINYSDISNDSKLKAWTARVFEKMPIDYGEDAEITKKIISDAKKMETNDEYVQVIREGYNPFFESAEDAGVCYLKKSEGPTYTAKWQGSRDMTMTIKSDSDEELLFLACWMQHPESVEWLLEQLCVTAMNAKEDAGDSGSGEAVIRFGDYDGGSLRWLDRFKLYMLYYKHGVISLEKGPLFQDEEKTYKSSAAILRNPVASVYKTLRILAIVALLTILVYVGIRMVLASVAKDKIKYKNMLIDWFVALVLVFVLHYIMSFIIDISTTLTGVIEGSSIENITLKIPNGTKVQNADGNLERLDAGDEKSDFWGTNFVGYIRFYAGLVQKRGYTVRGISYTLMYIVVVIYMVIFTWQYLKRVLYMAFLTMIAPLVAITYPIDKIRRWQSTRILFVAKRIYI